MKQPTTYALFICLLGTLIFINCNPPFSNDIPSEEEKTPYDWMYHQRAYPENYINADVYRDAVRQTMEAKKGVPQRTNHNWIQSGPINVGGRITDVALHPFNQDIFYAGSSVGGIWKTEDGGVNWDPIFEDQGVLTIGNLAIANSDPNVLYAGTGEANGSATSGAFFGNGVYKTTDAGENWTHVGLEDSQHIGRIAVDPANPNRVFVAAAGSLYRKNDDRGLYRSLDGGDNWDQVLFVSDSTSVIDVAINPEFPNIVYAVTWERVRFPWQRKYGGTTSGIWRSTDGGENWIKLENGLPPNDDDRGRIGITIFPDNPLILYACYTTNAVTNVFDGVYKTVNGGDSWFRVDDNNSVSNVFSSFGWFFGNIRVHPTNPDEVFLLGVPLIKSEDGGGTWFNIAPDNHVDNHGLEIHPNNPDFMVSGNDGGIYITQSGGFDWFHVKEIPITQFYEGEIDFLEPSNLYGGTQDNGTVRTSTGALDDWQRILGGDGFHVIVDPTDNNTIYAEFQFGNLFRSDNGGATMDFIFNGADGNRKNWNTPVVMDPNDPLTIYYGANILHKSEDKGQTWLPVSDDLTDGQHPSGSSSFGTLTTIAVAPTNSAYIYTGSDDGNVNFTSNGGVVWTNISDGLPKRFITSIAVDHEDESIVYVTISGYKKTDYLPHVFKSYNNGVDWEDISGDLPEIPVNDIIIDPEYEGTYYIANDLGVWVTVDGGLNWDILDPSLPATVVNDLDFHPEERILLASTFGRSMFTIDLNDFTNDEIIVEEQGNTMKVYPNPVVNEANIELKLNQNLNGKLELIDVSGRSIRVLNFNEFLKGKNQLTESFTNLSKGTYILRFSSRDIILVEKFQKM